MVYQAIHTELGSLLLRSYASYNFDGLMNPGTMTAWIGGVIRNHNRELVVA